MEIEETKTVYVAWTNSDLTEGRGFMYPLAICETEATAIRRGSGGYVQGANCPVTAETAVKLHRQWLVPGRIEPATDGDKRLQERIDLRNAAFEKARAAGLTDADIEAMRGSKD